MQTPAEIEDRAIPGRWEGDLLGGTENSHIVTSVERHSRFTALAKVANKETDCCGRRTGIAGSSCGEDSALLERGSQ